MALRVNVAFTLQVFDACHSVIFCFHYIIVFVLIIKIIIISLRSLAVLVFQFIFVSIV